ncbi:MAG: acetate--CoA ligase family protein [Spirochaetes bacterium]|nr:acetate--CoA ligase family protein [Spirochaetota bacterium]
MDCEQVPTTKDQLNNLFYPRSIAVVGTNRVRDSVPFDIFYNIMRDGYRGQLYPVSPREPSICDIDAYKYVIDIEDDIDLAVIVFPSTVCHLAMEQCGQKGIKTAIIISAGFREAGPAGAKRERQVKDIADRYGISFIGPNCLGLINTDPACSLNASFARKMPEEGSIALLSQSGALCTAVLDYARAHHIGFSKFVSFGNRADIDEIDLLLYLKDDPRTEVILLYLEEIRDGRALMDAARTLLEEKEKPVLILKSGATEQGASAASLHTGALAGSDEVCDAALRQAGIIRCRTVEDLLNSAVCIVNQPLPHGRCVSIMTNAGGPGVLATDFAVDEGLKIASFSEHTTLSLKKHLPYSSSITNPIDILGDAKAERYTAALKLSQEDENVDGTLVILTPQSMTDIGAIARGVKSISKKFDKPLYATFMGGEDVQAGVDYLESSGIPHFQRLQDMCKTFAVTCRIHERLTRTSSTVPVFSDTNQEKAQAPIDVSIQAGKSFLTEKTATELLYAYGFPVLPLYIAKTETEAVEIAEKICYPVVMKIHSESIQHKFDSGGVILNIGSEEEAKAAYRTIVANMDRAGKTSHVDGLLVSKYIEDGEEVILGLKRDPSFGPVLMFGLGGIFVELLRDVSFRIAPVDTASIEKMIREIRSYPVLEGFRGRPERDIQSIVECIGRLSQLALECPMINELDINPLIVHEKGKGSTVVDVKILLRGTEQC